MEKRILFPLTMFVVAGSSFAYGTWQYFFARTVQAAADARLAHVITTIEDSSVSRFQKQEMYSTIMNDLPEAPRLLAFDFSGSFASTQPDDQCDNDGQRAVCRALEQQSADPADIAAVCGICNPN